MVYANILLVLYAVAATVVLANLLIALISSHFQAEKVRACRELACGACVTVLGLVDGRLTP